MKKGFTLIELIIVVSLLSIIGITIGVSLNKVFKDQEQNDYNLFVEKVKSSANLYLSNNPDILNELYSNTAFKIICVQNLIDNGHLNKDTKNPKTGDNISGDEKIKASINSEGLISIEYPIDNDTEDYLQALDVFISLGTNKTDLCYEGLNTYKLCYVGSDGKCQSRTKSEIDAYIETSSGIEVCDDSSIPTNTSGKYKVYYEYNNGTKKAQRNIIVGDNDMPICEGADATAWSNQPKSVTLKCSDKTTECKSITYNKTTYNGSSTQIYMSNINQISYEIKDAGGNTKTCEQKVMIDTTLPEIKNIVINKDSIQAQATDNLSGIAYYAFSTNSSVPNSGEWKQTNKIETTVILKENKSASGTYYFYVKDAAGNVKRSDAIEIEIITTKPAPPTAEIIVRSGEVYGHAVAISSAISAYKFSKNINEGTWKKIDLQNETYIKYDFNEKQDNANYYFFVKDLIDNTSQSKEYVTSKQMLLTCTKTKTQYRKVRISGATYNLGGCPNGPYVCSDNQGLKCCCQQWWTSAWGEYCYSDWQDSYPSYDPQNEWIETNSISDKKQDYVCPNGYSSKPPTCNNNYILYKTDKYYCYNILK